ncbi:MAG: DJ-1/PfpI family protein [Deltaproteobacteria bacterium]|nr:DJ-1/PfpI family protein [Deltaproteobacteria bacterium]
MGKRACVLLMEGFEEIEAVVVVDVLRRADVQVTMIGVESRKVTGSHGISINVDAALDDVVAVGTSFDCVVLPGGMPGAAKLRDSVKVEEFVTRQHAAGAIAAAICAAPIALAKFGLLKGKKATCFPGFEEQLGGAIAQTDAVVTDGDIVTSRGVGTALAFSLVLVDRLAGTDTARTLATRMLVER